MTSWGPRWTFRFRSRRTTGRTFCGRPRRIFFSRARFAPRPAAGSPSRGTRSYGGPVHRDRAVFATTRDTHSTDHPVEPARTSENSVKTKFAELWLDELRRISIPRTSVNKGERMSSWEKTGRDEGWPR